MTVPAQSALSADDPPAAPGVLFEAVSAPPRSGTPRGILVLSLLLCGTAGAAATAFALMGAWPVMGFVGLELPLVVGLLVGHRRRAGRARERVLLADGTLRVSRTDARGRCSEAVLEPYWTRVEEGRRPGRTGELRLRCRGRSVEIGAFASEAERAELAHSLRAALRQYREPHFDNPQLRDG